MDSQHEDATRRVKKRKVSREDDGVDGSAALLAQNSYDKRKLARKRLTDEELELASLLHAPGNRPAIELARTIREIYSSKIGRTDKLARKGIESYINSLEDSGASSGRKIAAAIEKMCGKNYWPMLPLSNDIIICFAFAIFTSAWDSDNRRKILGTLEEIKDAANDAYTEIFEDMNANSEPFTADLFSLDITLAAITAEEDLLDRYEQQRAEVSSNGSSDEEIARQLTSSRRQRSKSKQTADPPIDGHSERAVSVERSKKRRRSKPADDIEAGVPKKKKKKKDRSNSLAGPKKPTPPAEAAVEVVTATNATSINDPALAAAFRPRKRPLAGSGSPGKLPTQPLPEQEITKISYVERAPAAPAPSTSVDRSAGTTAEKAAPPRAASPEAQAATALLPAQNTKHTVEHPATTATPLRPGDTASRVPTERPASPKINTPIASVSTAGQPRAFGIVPEEVKPVSTPAVNGSRIATAPGIAQTAARPSAPDRSIVIEISDSSDDEPAPKRPTNTEQATQPNTAVPKASQPSTSQLPAASGSLPNPEPILPIGSSAIPAQSLQPTMGSLPPENKASNQTAKPPLRPPSHVEQPSVQQMAQPPKAPLDKGVSVNNDTSALLTHQQTAVNGTTAEAGVNLAQQGFPSVTIPAEPRSNTSTSQPPQKLRPQVNGDALRVVNQPVSASNQQGPVAARNILESPGITPTPIPYAGRPPLPQPVPQDCRDEWLDVFVTLEKAVNETLHRKAPAGAERRRAHIETGQYLKEQESGKRQVHVFQQLRNSRRHGRKWRAQLAQTQALIGTTNTAPQNHAIPVQADNDTADRATSVGTAATAAAAAAPIGNAAPPARLPTRPPSGPIPIAKNATVSQAAPPRPVTTEPVKRFSSALSPILDPPLTGAHEALKSLLSDGRTTSSAGFHNGSGLTGSAIKVTVPAVQASTSQGAGPSGTSGQSHTVSGASAQLSSASTLQNQSLTPGLSQQGTSRAGNQPGLPQQSLPLPTGPTSLPPSSFMLHNQTGQQSQAAVGLGRSHSRQPSLPLANGHSRRTSGGYMNSRTSPFPPTETSSTRIVELPESSTIPAGRPNVIMTHPSWGANRPRSAAVFAPPAGHQSQSPELQFINPPLGSHSRTSGAPVSHPSAPGHHRQSSTSRTGLSTSIHTSGNAQPSTPASNSFSSASTNQQSRTSHSRQPSGAVNALSSSTSSSNGRQSSPQGASFAARQQSPQSRFAMTEEQARRWQLHKEKEAAANQEALRRSASAAAPSVPLPSTSQSATASRAYSPQASVVTPQDSRQSQVRQQPSFETPHAQQSGGISAQFVTQQRQQQQYQQQQQKQLQQQQQLLQLQKQQQYNLQLQQQQWMQEHQHAQQLWQAAQRQSHNMPALQNTVHQAAMQTGQQSRATTSGPIPTQPQERFSDVTQSTSAKHPQAEAQRQQKASQPQYVPQQTQTTPVAQQCPQPGQSSAHPPQAGRPPTASTSATSQVQPQPNSSRTGQQAQQSQWQGMQQQPYQQQQQQQQQPQPQQHSHQQHSAHQPQNAYPTQATTQSALIQQQYSMRTWQEDLARESMLEDLAKTAGERGDLSDMATRHNSLRSMGYSDIEQEIFLRRAKFHFMRSHPHLLQQSQQSQQNGGSAPLQQSQEHPNGATQLQEQAQGDNRHNMKG